MVFQASCQAVVMVVVPVVNTLTHVLCTLDRRFFSCIACCTHMAKVQIDEPCEKKEVPVSRPLLDQDVKASQDITAAKLLRYFTPI